MNLAKIKLKTKVSIFFISLGIVAIFNFGMMIFLEMKSIKLHERVLETHEVMELTYILTGHLIDAETGQRGYLLTEDVDYLELYYSGIDKSNIVINDLMIKATNNKELLENLTLINQLKSEKFKELQHTIELYKTSQKSDSLELVKSNVGKDIMDQIREEIQKAVNKEQQLLAQRNGSYTDLQEVIRWVFIIETIAFIFVLLILAISVTSLVLDPIRKINIALNLFKLGNGEVRVSVQNQDEIGELANGFNHMALRITEYANKLVRYKEEAESERDQALTDSIQDPLTGLFNRRYMEIEVSKILSTMKRYGDKVSLMMIDIDHFKNINDTYGHITGDRVIKYLSGLLIHEIRSSDMAIRYGGEEFLVIMKYTDLIKAEAKAEYLRRLVEGSKLDELDKNSFTISIGVTELNANDEALEQVTSRADKALYQAKNNGRNCVKTVV